MKLSTSLKNVKGVGVKTAEQFALSGLHTVEDLLYFLPRKHEDFSSVTPIAQITPGKRTIKATVESISTRTVRRGMRITTATLADSTGKLRAVWFSTGKLRAVWFNQPYRASQFKEPSMEFYFSGEFEYSYNRYQLTNPSAEKVSDLPVQTDRILPIYPSIKGLKSTVVRKILAELRPLMTMLPDTLPKSTVQSEKLVSTSDALLGIHFPHNVGEIERSRQRLAFEELFQLLVAAELNKRANAQLAGWHIPFEQLVVKKFVDSLPFSLTADQKRAAWDILQDFEKASPMNRLLQGDVGSGKTVVAGLAARQAASHGFQTALLAPTELLAAQHAETLVKLLGDFGVNVALLTGSVKGKQREALLTSLKSGNVDIH